eukprot:879541-Prorocentrum_minimum.AAC.2
MTRTMGNYKMAQSKYGPQHQSVDDIILRVFLLLRVMGPAVPITARVHSTPQIDRSMISSNARVLSRNDHQHDRVLVLQYLR